MLPELETFVSNEPVLSVIFAMALLDRGFSAENAAASLDQTAKMKKAKIRDIDVFNSLIIYQQSGQ